jgi:hypothetical protein
LLQCEDQDPIQIASNLGNLPRLVLRRFHGPALFTGGTEGPEGSVLVLLSEAIFIVLVAVIYRRRKYPLLRNAEAR